MFRFKPDKEAKREKRDACMLDLQILNKLLERAARCTHDMSPKNDEASPRHYSYSEYRFFQREGGNLYVNPVHYK